MNHNALGKILLKGKFLSSQDELDKYSNSSIENEEPLITTIVKSKKLDYVSIANYIAKTFGLNYLDLENFEINFLSDDIDLKMLEATRLLPLKKQGNTLIVATADPTNQTAINDLKFQSNRLVS